MFGNLGRRECESTLILWFTPHMSAVAEVGLSQSWALRAQCRSSMSVCLPGCVLAGSWSWVWSWDWTVALFSANIDAGIQSPDWMFLCMLVNKSSLGHQLHIIHLKSLSILGTTCPTPEFQEVGSWELTCYQGFAAYAKIRDGLQLSLGHRLGHLYPPWQDQQAGGEKTGKYLERPPTVKGSGEDYLWHFGAKKSGTSEAMG